MEGISDSLRSQQKGSLISCPWKTPNARQNQDSWRRILHATCKVWLTSLWTGSEGGPQVRVHTNTCPEWLRLTSGMSSGDPALCPSHCKVGRGLPGVEALGRQSQWTSWPSYTYCGQFVAGSPGDSVERKCCKTLKWDQIQLLKFKKRVMRIKSLCSRPYVGPCGLPDMT